MMMFCDASAVECLILQVPCQAAICARHGHGATRPSYDQMIINELAFKCIFQ